MMNNSPKGFTPHPYPYHHLIVLEIESLTNLGLGLGRDNGWVVQVPYVLPGEKVQARIYNRKIIHQLTVSLCIKLRQTELSHYAIFSVNAEAIVPTYGICNSIGMETKTSPRFVCTDSGIELTVNRPIPSAKIWIPL